MEKWTVLLRGVNIGKRKVTSKELKEAFIKAGFTDASTVLASGNVVISSNLQQNELQKTIELFLAQAFSFPISVIVLPIVSLKKIIAEYPFQTVEDTYNRYIIFCSSLPEIPSIQKDNTIEDVQINGKTIFWYVLKGHTLDSPFAKQFAKLKTGGICTNRNINTLQKILKKANE